MIARAANLAWLLTAAPEHRRFKAGLGAPGAVQAEILRRALAANSRSEFGQEHNFSSLDREAFRKRVPVRTAAEYEPWLKRASEGAGVLTEAPPLYFERTSGSTGTARLVPYTAQFRSELNQAVSAWMVSLSKEHPDAFRGPSYWSISPPLRGAPSRTPSGLRIGASDAEYLSPAARLLLSQILIPSAKSENADEFYFQTLRSMLASPLCLVSVWSPAFLVLLDEHLRANWPELLASLPRTKRQRLSSTPGTWKEIWPQLSVVSCWTDSWAARWMQTVKDALGNVAVQGKGLLSTEGVTSIPFEGERLLAYRSHFFEFLTEKDVLLAEDLRKGMICEVVLTTGGGLYRYATGDMVEVTGHKGKTPCLRFLGRNLTTDLAGEKVTQAEADGCLHAILAGRGDLEAVFQPDLAKRRYLLLITHRGKDSASAERQVSSVELEGLANAADQHLSANPYYAQARACRELGAVQAVALSRSSWNELLSRSRRTGRMGTSKTPSILEPMTDYAALHI